ncbi:MAG: radical SAM protein [Candidatus Woesearchaeota archaeon]
MAQLQFQTLEFKDVGEKIKVYFLKNFYFFVEKSELESIAPFKIKANKIIFEGISEKTASSKFNVVVSREISQNLKSVLLDKRTIYIHKNSGIPLIGNIAFGLLDRNTSIVEIRPVTGCNLNCPYCSISEGITSKKPVEFVIEKDYIIEELKKIIEWKEVPIEAHIGPHGEPFVYGDLLPLVDDLAAIEEIHTISIDTNGTYLTEEIIDHLAKSGKVRLNLSLDAIDSRKARIMAGYGKYDVKYVLKMINYAAKKMRILVAPVMVPGWNEEELPKIIKFAKEHNIPLGIQNYLHYNSGRKIADQMSWPEFTNKLKELESKSNVKLLLDFKKDFQIKETKPLPKPFYKGQIIEVKIAFPGRSLGEMIGIANDRTLTIMQCKANEGDKIKVKILRDKHNIFLAKEA